MASEISCPIGKVVYSDEVVRQVCGLIASECYGIVGMAVRSATDGFAELLKRDNVSKGVKVLASGDQIDITLYVIVEYGVSIATVGSNIIENVKYNVEALTGLTVTNVNINVQGIRV